MSNSAAPAGRIDQRRDYRHFPAAYGELLHAFRERGGATLGPMSERDARTALRDLYRFKMFLLHAAEHDPADAFAGELHAIARDAVMRVVPCAVVDPHGTHMVELSLNPVVRAMRDFAVGASGAPGKTGL